MVGIPDAAASITTGECCRALIDQEGQVDDGLPSVEITKRFMVLCEQYGSHKTMVWLIANGRTAPCPGGESNGS